MGKPAHGRKKEPMSIGRSNKKVVLSEGGIPKMSGFDEVVRFVDLRSGRASIGKANAQAEQNIDRCK
ncbi:MAG: hypothetical protein U0905_19380 [Pirellulales bacterium]